MRENLKKFLLLTIAAALFMTMLAGCGASQKPAGTSAVTTQAASEAAPAETSVYPMKPVTLTKIGIVTPADIDPLIGGDLNKVPFNIEKEKQTGVHIDYVMTTPEDYDTKMNLLITSNDIPDLFSLPSNYTGQQAKAFADGLIPDLNKNWDLLPNLKAVLDAHPDWMKLAKTDNGEVLIFPMFQPEDALVYFGPQLRKDLLDKLGLAVPETIDEWYNVLTQFKKAGVKWPFVAMDFFPSYGGDFVGAYQAGGTTGTNTGVYPGLDGKMVYGPMQPGYKDYLTTMNKWYKEGLIDPDFVTLKDWGLMDTKMTTGDSAACVHFLSRITQFTTTGKAKDPNFEMIAAPHPVLKKGDKPYTFQRSSAVGSSSFVYAKSPRVKEALRYMDYGYSPKGQLLINFGIEGESYTIDASGKPLYTDLMTKDPNAKGWSRIQSMGMYAEVQNIAPTVMASEHFIQTKLSIPAAKHAVEVWSNGQISTWFDTSTPNDEEVKVIAKQTDLNTYVDEMTAKFIIGSEPLSNFDKYVERIKQLNVDAIVAAYQSGYDRFNARK